MKESISFKENIDVSSILTYNNGKVKKRFYRIESLI